MEANTDRTLTHITQVNPLNDSDKPIMDELYQVLKKHGALSRFGITLLHDHFPIAEDEILVESTDIESRTQTLTTVKRKDLDVAEVIETSWRLDIGKNIETSL